MEKIRISEIFYSIQGESTFIGVPCVFIRFTGCNLRCKWCDTTYAYEGGTLMDPVEILNQAASYGCRTIEITGGEPMCQPDGALRLMNALIEQNYTVLLETNGTHPLDKVPMPVHRIIDLKPPHSNQPHSTAIWTNYAKSWRPTDQVKCVVCSRYDFDWCIEKLRKYHAFGNITVLFSPVWGECEPKELAQWICDAHEPIRMNFQIHKVIWDPNERGV